VTALSTSLYGPSVPYHDPTWQHGEIAADIVRPMLEVMGGGRFIGGPEVEAFEDEFAAFSGSRFFVSAASASDALELALRGAGLQAGQSVIVAANSFVANLASVVRAGGVPELVDCDSNGLLDPDLLPDRLTGATGAVVPVHSHGQMCRMDEIEAAVQGRSVTIVENAGLAHGATRHGRVPGAWSRASVTCFYHDRVLAAYGDGGGIMTDDPHVAARVRLLANHGMGETAEPIELGMNSQLDAMHAVVLRAKLHRVAGWISMRRSMAEHYNELLRPLADAGLISLPQVLDGNESVWSRYVIQVADGRDRVFTAMSEHGVETAIHYRTPLHLTQACRDLGYGPGDFPVAERLAREVLSLPIYPGMSEQAQERAVDVLAAAL
jgi:dTDP-4-amino-4,6-dideoxygalactose transaminase